jgi:hypothetical protein
MAVAVAPGTPQYSGTFVPEVWSGNLLVKFYASTVLAAISNTDYEGEIKNKGDKVIIRTVPDITIRDYSKNSNLIIQRPESPNIELLIDKAKYFNFICDDIDRHQTDVPLMNSWSDDAGQQMKIAVDTGVLADIYADAHASNKGSTAGAISGDIDLGATGSPVAITTADILDLIVNSGTALDEQNVPETQRSIVIPAWFAGRVKLSDLKDASLSGDGTSILRNGRLGMIDRFTLYSSNLLTSVSDGGNTAFHAIACQMKALSFAAQMTKLESLRAESTFGQLVRGLNVYGYKVLKPEALCDLYIRKG